MSSLPSAIIFVNSDVSENVRGVLSKQLYIAESMTRAEFDARLVDDPNYIDIVHLQNLRILVYQDFWAPRTGFELCDIAIFIKTGLAYIEINKKGPTGLTLPVATLSIYSILNKNSS